MISYLVLFLGVEFAVLQRRINLGADNVRFIFLVRDLCAKAYGQRYTKRGHRQECLCYFTENDPTRTPTVLAPITIFASRVELVP